jgi:hypothetical protein
MSEVFLGVIAAATLLMALIQVGVLVAGILAVKRINEVLARVEESARPVLAHVDDLVVDATASLAAGARALFGAFRVPLIRALRSAIG